MSYQLDDINFFFMLTAGLEPTSFVPKTNMLPITLRQKIKNNYKKKKIFLTGFEPITFPYQRNIIPI